MDLDEATVRFIRGYFAAGHHAAKTMQAYSADLRQFAVLLRKRPSVSQLVSDDIHEWLSQLRELGYSPASIKRKVVVLKVFIDYWTRLGVLSESPFWRIRIRYGRSVQLPRTITEPELKALLQYSDLQEGAATNNEWDQTCSSSKAFLALRNRGIIELLFATGIRVGEVSGMNLEDLKIDQACVRILGKGKKERIAFIVDRIALESLNRYMNARLSVKSDERALFINWRSGRLSSQGIANVIIQSCKKNGIQRHITPHMFRHTIATLLLQRGTDIRLVQEFLGHTSISTTQRYTHVTKDHLIRELRSRHPSQQLRILEEPTNRLNAAAS